MMNPCVWPYCSPDYSLSLMLSAGMGSLLGDSQCKALHLFVVTPEPQHFDDALVLEYLVDESVLNVDAP